MQVGGCDFSQQLFQGKPFAQGGRDHQPSFVHGDAYRRTFLHSGLFGKRSGDAHSEAVAPLLNSCLHNVSTKRLLPGWVARNKTFSHPPSDVGSLTSPLLKVTYSSVRSAA